MNNRTEIRAAIVSRLSGLTSESKVVPVFNARYLPVKTLPNVVVHTGGDVSEKSVDQQANRREEVVQIQVYVEGPESQQDLASGEQSVARKLDLLTGQIETIFLNQYEVLIVDDNAVVDRFNYVGTEIAADPDGTTVKLVAMMNYTAFVNEQLVPL